MITYALDPAADLVLAEPARTLTESRATPMHYILTIAATLAVIAAVELTRRSIIMAIGTESAAALAEVKTAIAVEADQAAEKIIEAVGADADTAAAIRELLTPIKGIIPDAVVEEGESGGVLEPGTDGGVVVEGDTDTPA